MQLKSLKRAKKEIAEWGKWSSGSLPKSFFPLSKTKIKVSKLSRWKVIKFTCEGADFAVLIVYRIDKEQYWSYLAENLGSDMTVIARLEYHATHPGWHMHSNCDTSKNVPGRTGGLIQRIPQVSSPHRRQDFGITGDASAEAKAVSTFGIDKGTGGILV